MTITTIATVTKKTHDALLRYRDDLEDSGECLTIPLVAGSLISAALHQAGYIERAEHVKAKE